MMFSDEEIKEMPEGTFMRPGDEIISIREVCLSDKYDKKDLVFHNEPLLSNSGRNDLDVPRSLFRDGFYPESAAGREARFAWTEEDGTIAALVSEPGFGTTGQTTFGKALDAALDSEMKEADTSSADSGAGGGRGLFGRKSTDAPPVSSTSSGTSAGGGASKSTGACKVDKADPRSRYHYVKYVKRHGRTVKLWECGICSREFQHQYTLMRHLPTHTDERNFHCAACGKSFRQLSTLSQHRAIHSAARPYACEMCNKTFNRVSTLISHRKTHSDEKPYKCHICPKGFHQKGNLRNHLFTHTNERPYRCNICLKGFNQQSNLVCHKNKAHSDEGCAGAGRGRSASRGPRPSTAPLPDSTRSTPGEHCEVSSSVGPYLPTVESQSSFNWNKAANWEMPKPYPEPADIWTTDGPWGSGVIVDPIKTYHMGVALATKQTPFALLKPDNNAPVLVKVVDTNLPGGKQMLVPATAEDLRVGGKIVLKNDDGQSNSCESSPPLAGAAGGAVQIRVPVVATVSPRVRAGRLTLLVREPHRPYHTALSSDVMKLDACAHAGAGDCARYEHDAMRPAPAANSMSTAGCALPPPAPSPPLDLIPMDLFEPMECMPMGPQITAVDNIDHPPHSDDSDIFIGEFEESIPLSDSD